MLHRLNLIAVAIAATAALSVIAVGEARAQPSSACCLANGTCQFVSGFTCEATLGGVSEPIGTDCSMVECPVLCGGSAPACDGQCPASTVCVEPILTDDATTAGNGHSVHCECVPEIPLGGACDRLADACAAGLSCVNGVCAAPPALAPALSPVSLVGLVGILAAIGGATLLRRRRTH